MAKSVTKRQKREKKKNLEKKIQQEVERKAREDKIKQEADLRYKQQQMMELKQREAAKQQMAGGKPSSKVVVNYIADRNGCGYFRSIFPFELLSTYKNVSPLNTFMYHFEANVLHSTDVFRFQRQATNEQLRSWDTYRSLRKQHGFKYKLQYEIDDLLMEIQPHNKIAFDYFDQEKKNNHMRMLHTSDSITFSTEALKDIYVNDYGVDASKINVVRNTLPQFLYSLPYRSTPKTFDAQNKPRVFWSGSGSHVGKGGDLDFIIDLVEKTLDEYQWVFQGVVPPELTEHVKSGKIEFLAWVPVYGLANMQFYKARPDICLAPLTPSRFNTCKSDLKYLEACALGAPCITTSFEEQGMKSPYDLANAEICLEPDADIWKAAIDHLVGNPDFYMETIKKQYDFVNGRWMESNLDAWAQTLI